MGQALATWDMLPATWDRLPACLVRWPSKANISALRLFVVAPSRFLLMPPTRPDFANGAAYVPGRAIVNAQGTHCND